MKRYYYALAYQSTYAFNDSREKMREWGTAAVLVYESKGERDEDVENYHLVAPIAAEEAYFFIGRPGSRRYAEYCRDHCHG